jgi:chromosome segregation ATPase
MIRGQEIEELKGQIHAKLPKEEFTLKEKFRMVEKERDLLKLQLSSTLSELDIAKKTRTGLDNISFSEQVVAYESEINALKNDIDDFMSSMEEKIREIEEIKERDREVLRREKTLTEEVANLKAEIVQKDELINNKAEEHEKHYAELLSYHKDNFTVLEKERNDLRDELTVLKEEKSGVDKALEEKEAGYGKEIDELKKDIDELTALMEEKVRESEEAREREQELVSREKELTEKITTLEQERTEEITGLEQRLATKIIELEGQLAEKDIALEGTIAEHKEKYEELLSYHHERFRVLEKERDDLHDELTSLKAEKTGVDDVLEEKEADYEREIVSLKKDIDELTISMEEKVRESEEAREREQELVSREKELTEEVSNIRDELQEHHERFRVLEKERDDLRDDLTRKDQMLVERTDTYRHEIEDLEKRIRAYETENQRLQDSVVEMRNEIEQSSRGRKIIEDQMVHVKDDISKREHQARERMTELTNELVQKEELLVETVEAHEQEKQLLQSTINDFETAIKRHENETKTLNINLAGVKSQADEYLKMYQEVDNQRKELDERLSEALKNMYELKNENERQQSEVSSKEQGLLNLQQEFNLEVHALNEKIERMNADVDKQVAISSEKAKEMSQMAQEKMDLLERISALESTFDRVRKDKDNEIVKMRDQLGTSFMKMSELENSLKVSLNANIDLRKKLEAKPESVYIEEDKTAEPLRAKPEPKPEPEPAPRPEIRDLIVYNERKNWLSYINYAFLFVLLIISLLILYRTFVFTSQPQRPSELSALYDLTYDEVFTLLTRDQSTDNIKVQATMVSELLMRRENAGRILSQFDFKRFYYLKININALNGSLSQKFIDNPREGILITDGDQEVRPAQGVALENVKTFYKKDEPVSLSFLYIIPKDRTVSALKRLELVLSDRGEAVQMSWDIQKLKTDKIIR